MGARTPFPVWKALLLIVGLYCMYSFFGSDDGLSSLNDGLSTASTVTAKGLQKGLQKASGASRTSTSRKSAAGHKSAPPAKRRFAVATFTTSEQTYSHLSLSNKQQYAYKNGYDFLVDFQAPLRPTSSGVWWYKFIMTERMTSTGKYDWIWFIDFDTLITNSSIRLEHVIDEALAGLENPDQVDMILNDDCNRLNAGSLLIRASPSAMKFLQDVAKYGDKHRELTEQGALKDVIDERDAAISSPSFTQGYDEYARDDDDDDNRTESDPDSDSRADSKSQRRLRMSAKKTVVMVPQYKINAFPEEIKCYDRENRPWEPGMLLVHFAGAWAHIKNEDPYGVLMRKYAPYVV